MTIYDYLSTLKSDYEDPTSDLVYSKSEVTQLEKDEANGNPYVQVKEFEVGILYRYQQGKLMAQFIDLNVYQVPNEDGSTPGFDKMMALWNSLLLAESNVDENVYDDSFVDFQFISGSKPHHDVNSGGLAADLRFRMRFTRPS